MDTLRRRAATARLLTRAQAPPPLPSRGELDQLAARVQSALPRYTLGEPIGRGGSSVVFAAREERLGRDIALKVFIDLPGSEPAARERFAREARAMAGLAHPNVVVIHDFGQTDDLDWIAMERIEGITLRQVLFDGALDSEEFAGIALPLLDAVEFSHARGVVHRDLKPENILIDTSGHVKVCDFGIAKWAGPATHWQTHSGVALGTPRYVAPEQIEAPDSVDERADVFALGVVLYEMLTGEVPAGHFEPPSQRAGVSEDLDSIVLRAMSRQPASRYASVRELKRELTATLSGLPIESPPLTSMASIAGSQAEGTEHGSSMWIDFIGFLMVGLICSIPGAIGRDSIFGHGPESLLLVGPWLIAWLVGSPQNRWKGKPLSFAVRPAVGAWSLFWLGAFYLEHDASIRGSSMILYYMLFAMALAWLVLGLATWLPSNPESRLERRAAKEARKLQGSASVVKFWEASQLWDWLLLALSCAIFLPELHEDGYLMKEAQLWLIVPVAALVQAIGVSGSLEEKNSATAAAARILGGALTGMFLLIWGLSGAVDDLETNGRVLFGLLLIFASASIVSGLDWWQRLQILGVDTFLSFSEPPAQDADSEESAKED